MNNNHWRSKFGRIRSAGDAKQLERMVDSELRILNITNIFFYTRATNNLTQTSPVGYRIIQH